MSDNETSTEEHSDRARWVTHLVTAWIENDSDYANKAREMYQEFDMATFGQYLATTLRRARKYTAPWQCAQELAPNDYQRIHWSDVADSLLEK